MAGRGVDILLGGNPEGLARRECMREGLDVGTPEYDRRATQELLRRSSEDECKAEGDKVRELGGLYVLGTERHESRAASTTSCAAGPAARATRARAASTCRSKTS